MNGLRLLFCVLVIASSSGCALLESFKAGVAKPIPVATPTPTGMKTVWVVGHGWHTGLVVRKRDISPGLFAGLDCLPDTETVELGWGDEGFYRAEKITAPLIAKAMLVPTPSVLHVAGFDAPVQEVFASSQLVEVSVSSEQFDHMCQFMAETFAKSEIGKSIPLGPGLYGQSTFYRAVGSYYAPKTCNVWTAKALKRAGFAISPQIASTQQGVMMQIRQLAKRSRAESPMDSASSSPKSFVQIQSELVEPGRSN